MHNSLQRLNNGFKNQSIPWQTLYVLIKQAIATFSTKSTGHICLQNTTEFQKQCPPIVTEHQIALKDIRK